MTSLRSSQRRTTSTPKRYTVDAFDGIDASQLGAFAGDDDDDEHDPVVERSADDNDDFNDDGQELRDPDEDDLFMADDLEMADEAGDMASDAGESEPDDDDDDASVAEDPDEPLNAAPGQPTLNRRRGRGPRMTADGERLYTRGAVDATVSRLSGQWRKTNFFGPAREDYEPMRTASIRWAGESTFPTRKSRYGTLGGLAYSIAYQHALQEVDANWKWYTSDGGKDAFQQRQTVREISSTDAVDYLELEGMGERSFIMGALGEQTVSTLQLREAIPLSRAFDKGEQARHGLDSKPGFLLNLGARVQALDWAPSRESQDQYLAVSVLSWREEDGLTAPAFKPQTPHQSSIQIWRFSANDRDSMDTSALPYLSMVLCTSMGDIRALKWCPIPSRLPGKLGLLACIGTDGGIRVLDLDVPPEASDTVHLVIEQYAFASKPPDTVCTCLAWISSTRILAGCANGFAAVWDLKQSLHSVLKNPRPIIYTNVSTTYVLAIVSCWPSYPKLIIVTSMAGHLTLIDISKPSPSTPTNSAHSTRTRIGQPMLVWNDAMQAAFSVDDGFMLRSYLLRRFFTTISVAKFRAMPLCMASSPCHPFLLAGATNGEVIGCNPIIRIAHGGKASLWQQIWFKHEWRRPTLREQRLATDGQVIDAAWAVIAKEGLSRISEGYKIEHVNLHSDGRAGPTVQNGTQFATIFEEKTAVTALAWNPNLHVGGWAAAGMANGLLRVEDIAQ